MNSFHPISIPKPHAMKLPKPIKVPAPKIAAIHIAKVGNKFKVQHLMTHGPKKLPFVFSDPNKMKQHLARIQSSEWRMPDRNEAGAMNKVLDLDAGTGTSSW